jgi:uncharacterized protein
VDLTRTERWILSNQYLILEALHPDRAADFAAVREALENGYEIEYDGYAEHIYDDRYVMSIGECNEVADILDMYVFLKDAYNNLEDKSGLEESEIQFPGFSGNHETKQLGYVRHLFHTKGHFTDLAPGRDDFNGHLPVLPTYRKRLAEWRAMGKKTHLSKDEILRILAAR